MAGRPPNDPAPAGMRNQVIGAASQAWRQPMTAYYLGRSAMINVRFAVPGLRRDGTPVGQAPVSRFFVKLPERIVMFVVFLLTVPIVLAWLAIQIFLDTTNVSLGITAWRRKVMVTAPTPMTDAAWSGQAFARGRGHLWLVAGPSTVAFVGFADGRQDVLWTSAGRPRPQSTIDPFELRWPDGSNVHLAWLGREYKLHARQR